jgi:hypothetical protein
MMRYKNWTTASAADRSLVDFSTGLPGVSILAIIVP